MGDAKQDIKVVASFICGDVQLVGACRDLNNGINAVLVGLCLPE